MHSPRRGCVWALNWMVRHLHEMVPKFSTWCHKVYVKSHQSESDVQKIPWYVVFFQILQNIVFFLPPIIGQVQTLQHQLMPRFSTLFKEGPFSEEWRIRRGLRKCQRMKSCHTYLNRCTLMKGLQRPILRSCSAWYQLIIVQRVYLKFIC